MRILGGAALALALMTPAIAQDLNVNVFINYGFAHREGAWAPVEVMINNKYEDMEGVVEVRTYDYGDRLQSPIYHVPMESPRDSVKRFKLHCLLKRTETIEVRIYNGRREVDAGRVRIKVQPIGRNDFLCLVLDDRSDGYGFLSTSLYRGWGEDDQKVSFFRQALNSEELVRLADYPQCYTPFDLIVIGDIDPARMSSEHRALLESYVREGGVVAVCSGEHADRLKGTWVETLAGVSLGAPMVYDETALAEAVFGDETGATPNRDGAVTRLTPTQPGMRTAGSDPTLATLRPLGDGFVATLAIDAESGLLQGTPQFQALWRDLSNRRSAPVELSFDSAASNLLGGLSRVAGVELVPMSSVVAYLVIYFLVAIVGNWIFWSWRKRREYAWLCLIVFSIGFTSYAMIYGTQGRAKQTELEEIEVLRMQARAPGEGLEQETAAYTDFAGLLARGSGRYEGSLSQPDALVDDLELYGYDYYRSGNAAATNTRPFYFVQERPGRVEDLAIGASEMRFVRIDGRVPLGGSIEAAFRKDDDGISGEVVNKTGIPLEDCYLIYGGRVFALQAVGGQWKLRAQHNADVRTQFWGGNEGYPYYYYEANFAQWQTQFRAALLQGQYNLQMRSSSIRPGLPPLIMGFARSTTLGGFAADDVTKKNLQTVIMVAEVDLASNTKDLELPLPVEVDRRNYGDVPVVMLPPDAPIERMTESKLRESAAELTNANAVSMQVLLPQPLPRFARIEVEIWVGAQGEQAAAYLRDIELATEGPLQQQYRGGIDWERALVEGRDNLRFTHASLSIDDLDPIANVPVLIFHVSPRRVGARGYTPVYAFARLINPVSRTQEEFTLWQ